MGFGKGTDHTEVNKGDSKVPNEMKVSVKELTPERAGWILVFTSGKVAKGRKALNLFRGIYSMFSGTNDEELKNWVQVADRYSAPFATALDKVEANAKFEAENASFVASVKTVAEWAKTH